MIELRLRNSASDEEIEGLEGLMLEPEHMVLQAHGAVKVLKPDGSPLLVYLPKHISEAAEETAYPALHQMRVLTTNNRGAASGGARVKGVGTNTYAKEVASSIAGSMEATGRFKYCRLTAFTKNHMEQWQEVYPLLQEIAAAFREYVPARYEAQVAWGAQSPEWLIPGTPFTTVTVNNTYPTGAHYDKGDLHEGFSTLACFRRGDWDGGTLIFPKYRVGVNMQNRDLMLMDAHEMHGNLRMGAVCPSCEKVFTPDNHNSCTHCGSDANPVERISVVSYYRTDIASCDSMEREVLKAQELAEARLQEQLAG